MLVFCCLPLCFLSACWRPSGIGVGGHYLDAKAEITKRGGNADKAIADLTYVVTRDPFYHDSLTLLGRAYYTKGFYSDALKVFARALAINKQDEIAWVMLGLTQLRLGDDVAGLESLKGGLTLVSKASKDGYRGIEFWDRKGLARKALQRAAFVVTKGTDDKKAVIGRTEALIAAIDNEEWFGQTEEYLKAIKAQ